MPILSVAEALDAISSRKVLVPSIQGATAVNLLLEALERFHHFYGPELKVECPVGSGRMLNLQEVARELGVRHVVRGIERLEQRSDSPWIAWLRLRQLACEGTAAMSEVNGQWQDLLKHRETTLPA